MSSDLIQVLGAASQSPGPAGGRTRSLLVAGATGVLGNEVMRRMVGLQLFNATRVLAREPITPALRTVTALVVQGDEPGSWPCEPAATGIIMFDPPRLYYDRERALWTPEPGHLVALAQWMRACGVQTLAVVLPHAQGQLPEALKRGLATLDEHAVVALGFERVLIVRSARKPAEVRAGAAFLEKTAAWMLSVLSFMVPGSEQPVRASKVAELVSEALQAMPAGIHIAAPELVWRAAQGDVRSIVRAWLQPPGTETTAKSGP